MSVLIATPRGTGDFPAGLRGWDAAKTRKVPLLESPRRHRRGVGHLGGSVWRKCTCLWPVVLICCRPCELDPSAEARWRRNLSCLVPSLVGGRNRPPLSPSSCPEQVDVPYSPPALPPFTSPALPSIPPAIPSASLLRGTGPAPAASPLGTLTACASSRPKEKPSGASFQGRVLRRSPGACSVPAPTQDRGPGPRQAPALSPVLSLPCHARSLVKSEMKIDPQELFLAGSAGCCAQHVLGLFSLLRIFFSPSIPSLFLLLSDVCCPGLGFCHRALP